MENNCSPHKDTVWLQKTTIIQHYQTALMDFFSFWSLTHFCLKVKKVAWAILLITWNNLNK